MISLYDIMLDVLDEGRYKYIVRGRKKVKRLKPRKGYKVVDGKYVKMKSSEKMKRKIAQRKAAKKRKSKKSQINRKRKLSMKKRKSLGLK